MSRASRTIGLTAAATDVLLLLAGYFAAYEIRQRLGAFPEVYEWERYLVLPLVGIPVWLATGIQAGLYSGKQRSIAREAVALLECAVVAGISLAALAFLFKQQEQSRPLVVVYMVVAFFQALAARVLVRLVALGQPEEVNRVIIMGSGEEAEALAASLRRQSRTLLVGAITEDASCKAPREVQLLGTLADAEAVFRREVVDEVIFVVSRAGLADAEVEHAFAAAEDLGLDAKLCLSFLPNRISRVDFEDIEGTPVLSFASAPGHPVQLALKRVFDILVSSFALVVTAPLFAAVALAIKLDSPGPIFFGQERLGLNGRRFRVLKFRSMVADAERRRMELQARNEMSGPVFKMALDPRITRVGRFLRKTSLDEFPQFWNVLVGDMSVVGPRPPIPNEVTQYLRWQRRRLSVKPGITCIWQISGRNEIDFETWMKLDLAYIDQWSLWLDLKIVLKTIPVVLLGRGAR